MLPILVLLGVFTFGSMLLIVFLRAQRFVTEFEERPSGMRRMYAQAAPGVPPHTAFVRELEKYLNAEQVLADQFVAQPSVENLYRESGTGIRTHFLSGD